ncbi:MAG: YicC/YloC family endoribonuclease, partial [Terriglobales bacterium]
MSIRSMTGYAQVRAQVHDGLGFSLALKSVNHRFLDLHLRMPPDSDALEMQLRRAMKTKLARGHVELTLSIERSGGNGVGYNRALVTGYVETFRAMAREFGVEAQPDLNAILRLPGAMDGGASASDEELDAAVMHSLDEAVAKLDAMRAEEGRGID